MLVNSLSFINLTDYLSLTVMNIKNIKACHLESPFLNKIIEIYGIYFPAKAPEFKVQNILWVLGFIIKFLANL